MNSDKFWKILVLFLVLLNMATLGFLIVKSGHDGPPKHNDQLLIEGLHFDEAQVESFQQLKHHHRHDMDSLEKIEASIRDLVIQEIQKGEGNDSLQEEYINQLAGIKNTKDHITLNHFKDLYHLLREDQKPYYKETIEKLAKGLMMGGRKPKPRD